MESLTTEEKTHQMLDQVMNELNGSSVLDVGCGYGRLAIPLAENGFGVVGVDVNQAYVEEARRRSSNQNSTFYCEDILEFTPEQTFDNIICMWNTLMHFDDNELEILVGKFHDWLENEGVFFGELLRVTDADKKFLKTTDDGSCFMFEVGDNAIPMHMHPQEDIKEVLDRAGFSAYDVLLSDPYQEEHLQRIIIKASR